MNPGQEPADAAGLIALSREAQGAGDVSGMLRFAERAHLLKPSDPEAALRLAECRLFTGDTAGAIALLTGIEAAAGQDRGLLQRIAEHYTQCGRHEDALRCLRAAAPPGCADPRAVYNLAAACIANGAIDEAERLLTEVIRLDPGDHDAWYNRSTLRRQTIDDNHVEQLKYVLAHLSEGDPGRTPVCYALAKELEDLGRHEASFAFLQAGAAARRTRLAYRVEQDEATMARISEVFDPRMMGKAPVLEPPGRPVFVLGLPRSGTTLIDRIIASHSRAASLGEINTLAFAVMQSVAALPRAGDGELSKQVLVERSAGIDFDKLRRRYLRALQGFGPEADRLIDKTPLNFLYIGLIRLALPQARIVHVRRHPLDSCYAMYKTLFRLGYPFSYSLQDVGRYTIAQRRLMEHWRAVAGDILLDVDYEAMVADPRGQTERLLEFLGLPFEESCLRFHESAAPAATASAAQVREPIHARSVGLWKRYARQLAPLARKLEEHGIDTA